jgi:dephospho-CoA kinase
VLIIGLTGGIACGKSVVADAFVTLGAGLVDTDRIARDVVAPGTPGLREIVREFGPGALLPGGELDRAGMRRRIFADPASRSKLEAIMHPLIRARTLEELRALCAPYAVVAVPLLLETGFAEMVDRILVVDCAPETQLERLMRRDRLGADEARAIVAAQIDRAARLDAADDVIDNDGDLEACRAQVAELHERYLKLAENCSKVR